ncbi:hypothetical protein LIER_17902 [Lithospermum erythrorhizon]|uniref:Uncharacterized protein n=1 Tax=Lithospermum erythrorhizon TaxID=34254 RepID=A0AAV3QG62_LITER
MVLVARAGVLPEAKTSGVEDPSPCSGCRIGVADGPSPARKRKLPLEPWVPRDVLPGSGVTKVLGTTPGLQAHDENQEWSQEAKRGVMNCSDLPFSNFLLPLRDQGLLGVKIASPPPYPLAPLRPSMGLLAPRAAPWQTAYNALFPLLDQAEMQRVRGLGTGL